MHKMTVQKFRLGEELPEREYWLTCSAAGAMRVPADLMPSLRLAGDLSSGWWNVELLSEFLFCRVQESLNRLFYVDVHPIRENREPPDAFTEFVTQFVGRRISDRPPLLLCHGEPSDQGGVGQEGQGVFLDRPLRPVVSDFQLVVSGPDSPGARQYIPDLHFIHQRSIGIDGLDSFIASPAGIPKSAVWEALSVHSIPSSHLKGAGRKHRGHRVFEDASSRSSEPIQHGRLNA